MPDVYDKKRHIIARGIRRLKRFALFGHGVFKRNPSVPGFPDDELRQTFDAVNRRKFVRIRRISDNRFRFAMDEPILQILCPQHLRAWDDDKPGFERPYIHFVCFNEARHHDEHFIAFFEPMR